MDKQKRIVIWTSVVLVIIVVVLGVWTTTMHPEDISKAPQSTLLSEAVLPTDWTTGSNTATVSLVEYGDFQCPICGAYHNTLKQVIEDNKNIVTFTYRQFPLPLTTHPNAANAAYASEAAGTQGKFWEMHDMIFEHQEEWSASKDAPKIFEGYATTLGLDLERFKADRDSEIVKNNVAHDLETGRASAVEGTPTFYINGKKVTQRLHNDVAELDALIKQAAEAHE